MPTLEGQMLKGRYRIEALVGRGGMAEVYKAWDTRRNYHVAIKVMREDLAEDIEFVRRFKREARALAELAHANVVRFYSFEREGPLAFIVMDYIEGTTLRRRILEAEGSPLPLDEVLSITQQVCAALHYAHQEGVLHRDVKPGNIMIQPDPLTGTGGRVLLSDFGIAKAADAATATTVMPGTPAYMSPEQCRSEPLDVRTDVYSLGILVYEMLAGRRPFVGESEGSGTDSRRERIRWEQVHAAPPPLRQFNPALPRQTEEVVLKALAKKREERWPTALAFWQALAEALGEKMPKAAALAVPPPTPPVAPPHVAPEPAPQPTWLASVPPGAWAASAVVLAGLFIVIAALVLSRPPVVVYNTPTRPPTAMPVVTPTPRQPTVTPTPVPPTFNPVPPTRTFTPVPPTPTHTPRPSTPTYTPLPSTPTSTPVPPTPTPVPQFPEMSGRILFTSNRDGAHQLYVLSLADDKISRLTRSGEDDWEPSWGSDGRIVFTCCRSGNCNICVANGDGSGESVLVTRPEWDDHPAWWPNGRYIAFSTTGEIDGAWHAQIHKVDLTGNLSRLTFAQSEERYPAWSPDGAWIAFDSERDGNRGIYKMRADGSDVTRLTHDGAFDEQAAWSPDGSQIAFIRKTVDTDGGGIGRDDFGDILVMDSDGSSPHPLTSCNCAVDPRWSPDGRWIVYARGDSNKTHGSMLWALRVSDGFQVQLTTGPRDWRPAWAW